MLYNYLLDVSSFSKKRRMQDTKDRARARVCVCVCVYKRSYNRI